MIENHGYWTVGNYLLEHRKLYHMTQKHLADVLGISMQYLCDLEHDRRSPSEELLTRITAEIMPNSKEFMFAVIGRFSPETFALMKQLPTYIVGQEIYKFSSALRDYAYGHLRHNVND